MMSAVRSSECEICLSELSPPDMKSPLLCPTKCGFNMCLNCIEHLVSSYQSGFHQASDGSMQVRVKLQCPKCRGDISSTIRDTCIVRKAVKVEEWRHVSDSELNGSELREKYALTVEEIEAAKLRLESFRADLENQKTNQQHSLTGGGGSGDDQSVQSSIISSNENPIAPSTTNPNNHPSPSPPTMEVDKSKLIDNSLLFGLDQVMSDDEKIYVTQLMISGNANKLAQAAQILSEIGRALNKGYYPGAEHNKTNKGDTDGGTRTTTNNNLSETEKKALEMGMLDSERIAQNRIERHRQMHPLPDRMPRYVILEANFNVYAKHGKVLKFVDDDWDGTVADAFARNRMADNANTDGHNEDGDFCDVDSSEVLCLDSDDEGEVDDFVNQNVSKYKNRVLIKAARKQAARLGIQRGDVVSHINGDEFRGKAEDLRKMIHNFYESCAGAGSTRGGIVGSKNNGGEYTFSLTLNAEQGTAAALKLRAMVETQLQHDSKSNLV